MNLFTNLNNGLTMIPYKRLTVGLLTWLFLLPALHSQPYCDVRTFSIRNGLAASIISDIDQSADGLMWFSTFNGLCNYDGYRFTTFHENPGSDFFSTYRIAQICPDTQTGIWVVTFDSGLYRLDTKTCQYTNVGAKLKEKTDMTFVARNLYSLTTSKHTWISSERSVGFCLRVSDEHPDSTEFISCKTMPLPSEYVKKVMCDSQGREWVFTDSGIMLYGTDTKAKGNFEYMAEAAGQVFLAEEDGKLYVFDSHAGSLQHMALTPEPKKIRCLQGTKDGELLIGTESGVLELTAKSSAVRSLAENVGTVVRIDTDSRGDVWLFTEQGDIALVSNGMVHRLTTAPYDAASVTTSGTPLWIEDNHGTVWVAPKDGPFCYYDKSLNCLHPYMLRSEGYDYNNVPTIRRFLIDRQQNLWFTSRHDLTLVNPKYYYIKRLSLARNCETRSLTALRDGTVWAGTREGYIAAFSADGRSLGYIDRQGHVTNQPVIIAPRIYAIKEDSKGNIWIGTRGDGLFMLANGTLSQYKHDDNDKQTISNDNVFTIDEDDRGNIWVGSYGGGLNLIRQTDGKMTFLHQRNGLTGYPQDTFPNIRRIIHDNKGTVIISTTTGLVTMSNRFATPADIKFHTSRHVDGDTASLRTSDVLQTVITRKGTVYVTTMGGFIQRLTSKTLLQDNLRFTTPKNQRDGNVLSLTEDAKGNVWVTRENMIDHCSPKSGLMAEYGANDLSQHIEFTEAQALMNPADGRIWMGTMDGVIAFLPEELKRSQYRPDIVFTSVQFQGESQPRPLLHAQVLEVPTDKRSFTLKFAALDYRDNEAVRYAYKLVGVDKDWNYVGQEHQAQLSHLKAGHYRFIVKSTNSDGIWTDNQATLYIYVHPTFWETLWAKLLYLLIAAIVAWGIIHIINLRRRTAMQREMDEMKTRFYTDVSHKLRTPLTLIGGPVTEVLEEEQLSEQSRKHLEMVQRNSRNMLDLVNKMLDRSSNKNFYVDDHTAPVFATPAPDATVPEAATVQDATIPEAATVPAASTAEPTAESDAVKLLIVEDNDDLRAFLVSILQGDYNVIQAPNGRIGLETATTEQPDFIITDVMMPEMDGLTMVHQIKQNPNICHIPIVVLSAKASLEDRLQGLKEGIDDYITKPFSATYLRQRIENIIAQRRMLQQAWLGATTAEGEHREYKLDTPQIVDADQEMMEKLMKYLESRISDQYLKVEEMADAVNLGRTVFYGKIKSIVGMAPVDFLKHIRIQRAEELISRSRMSISEIAYSVGFTDPKYFTKCFKKETGLTPTDYREQKNRENENS